MLVIYQNGEVKVKWQNSLQSHQEKVGLVGRP